MSDDVTPQLLGLMGYSIAKEQGQIRKGLDLCNRAIAADPRNADNYLYLGKLLLIAGKKEQAIKIFRAGLKIRKDKRVVDELQKLGVRKPPPIDSLPRDHSINIIIGKLLRALRLR